MNAPTINVNLPAQCVCGGHIGRGPPAIIDKVSATCPAKPVLIPCRLPKSFACEAVLGECTCPKRGRPPEGHWRNCPARPVRVSASVTSPEGSWEKSHLVDINASRATTAEEMGHIASAIDDRWALVKALVMGHAWGEYAPESWDAHNPRDLFSQRDTVFSALCEERRTAEAHKVAHHALFRALNDAGASWSTLISVRPSSAEAGLAAYIERLVEQVGNPNGGQ